ncbi:uncharacterized protein LOC26535026 [Drosophila yakuba]|uniref:Uncharacterized protein n=1 Tax=Drosophila yakuba TaxID=7245 RepID=A0A0R1DLY5_DROYA|nr:uncharacterized protein LOC26535026 [Drosophila yakuba]KRJ98252.1 uncharacterized protein Dyak_GE27845 [Drosophila yakuba]
MRRLAVHIAIFYLFQWEIGAVLNEINELKSWLDQNIKGRQDSATIDTLIMLCVIEMKAERKLPARIDFQTTNENTVQNYIILPTIKISNITIVFADEKSRVSARSQEQNRDKKLDIAIGLFKDCITKKINVLDHLEE